MSEATSIVGTVGAWVGGLVVLLLTHFIAYKMKHITTSSDRDRNLLLRGSIEELRRIRAATDANRVATEANLQVLQRVEKIAIEVKNESGTVFVIQRGP